MLYPVELQSRCRPTTWVNRGAKIDRVSSPPNPRSEKLAQIRNPHRLGVLVSPPRCPLPMRILQANPTGGVGLAFWALTPKTFRAFALPLVLRKVSQRPRCRPKPSLETSCSCSPRGSMLPHSGSPCFLSGAEALWQATVGEMLAATRSCRDGSLSFGFFNAGLSSFAEGSEAFAEAQGFPTRRRTFVRRPQSPPQSPHQSVPKNLPFAWSTCSVGLRGWCRVVIVVACALTPISRPPFDLLAEAKKGHVWLDPKKNHSGKSTLYPLHLQTIVDIEIGESCRPDSAAKIHQERCRAAFRL